MNVREKQKEDWKIYDLIENLKRPAMKGKKCAVQ